MEMNPQHSTFIKGESIKKNGESQRRRCEGGIPFNCIQRREKKEQEGKRSILFTDISEGCEDGKGKEITEDTED